MSNAERLGVKLKGKAAMTNATIHIAHSKARNSVTVYSYESWPQSRPGLAPLKAGWRQVTHDSLDLAMADALERIRHDWHKLGLEIPAIVDHGKVSAINGRTFTYAESSK